MPHRWKLDEEALTEVKDFLGITLPVWVSVGSGRRMVGFSQLCYGWQLPASAPKRFRMEPVVHRVQISARLSAAEASGTMWHELAHAMQYERVMGTEGSSMERVARVRDWNNENHRSPYAIRPSEVEARSYEEHAAEIAPCVSPAGIPLCDQVTLAI